MLQNEWSVSRVQPDTLQHVWLTLRPQIMRGLEEACGDQTTEVELFRCVAHGEADLWVVHRESDILGGCEILGGLILQVQQRERGKALVILQVVAMPGKGLRYYLPGMLARIRDYGELIGAYTIESYSRLGAARLMQKFGCKPKAMVMELRI